MVVWSVSLGLREQCDIACVVCVKIKDICSFDTEAGW